MIDSLDSLNPAAGLNVLFYGHDNLVRLYDKVKEIPLEKRDLNIRLKIGILEGALKCSEEFRSGKFK